MRNVSQTEEGLWRSMKEVKRYQEGPDAQCREESRTQRASEQSVKQNPPTKHYPGEIGHPWPSDKPTVLGVHKHISGVREIVTPPASGPATERNPTLSG